MMRTILRLPPISAMLVVALGAVPALADAIDGDWCFGDGRRMAIEGPRIVTPGGTRMTGNYDRHGFDYVVPAREPGAGSTVRMVLLDEDTVRVAFERPQVRTEIWRRCGPPIS